jgi:asparagine synthase (glutamine-hydrolysing)
MCGIAGALTFGGDSTAVSESAIRRMTDAIQYRGPDDDGFYLSPRVGLGHRRLSIIDLNTGKQPIANEDRTVWIVYNGEIYNYVELTAWLEARGHRFRTATDTEVIVHLYEELGDECLSRLQGMFSFALWDERHQKLLLARDRVGVKPLYFGRNGELLLFGSEIKALLAHGAVEAEVDEEALDTFLTYLYLPGERTLFRNIYKLAPGHYLTARATGDIRIAQYWDLHFPPARNAKTFEQCVSDLTHLLDRTVRNHMISDVPVGVLLSGGVDSTGVLSFAVENTDKPISTFTVGFDASECPDERPYARLAAERFETRHHEMTISSQNFLEALPAYVSHMEEPICEPPGIALYFVTRLAREYVTVLLSGEGGDEAFAGYQNYRNLVWLERIKKCVGPAARPLSTILPRLGTVPGLGLFKKYAPLLRLPLEAYYYSRTANPFDPFTSLRQELYTDDFQARLKRHSSPSPLTQYFARMHEAPVLDRMLYVDTKTWLPDDLLVKADKMTMANSVELRVPLLDHHILEFAATLPAHYKLKGWTTKRILKSSLRQRIPEAILNRPKTGFPIPYARWLQQDLREPLRALLSDRRTVQRGYFRPRVVERLLRENSSETNYSKEIFSLAVLELWHRRFVEQKQVALA